MQSRKMTWLGTRVTYLQRFCLVCHRLLSKDAAIRPQTADEVLCLLVGNNFSKVLAVLVHVSRGTS